MRQQELLRKADMALADLTTSGLLTVEQTNRFFRKMLDEPSIVRDARVVRMRRPKMEINKIGFGTRMLRAANQGTISSPRSGEEGTRALARADRYKPTTEKISLETSEVIAEIDLPYELLEDNIEGGDIDQTQFQQTILEMMATRAVLDLEELMLQGDTNSGDAFLALQDGVLDRASSNIVNHNNAAMDPDLFGNMLKSLPTQFHRLLDSMRFYLHTTKEIDYRMQVAQRQTQLGDAILTGRAPVSVLGVPIIKSAQLPTSNCLLTVPQNLLFGIQRDVRLEFDKDVRERVIIIVMTMRIAFNIEEEIMVVKATNIG